MSVALRPCEAEEISEATLGLDMSSLESGLLPGIDDWTIAIRQPLFDDNPKPG